MMNRDQICKTWCGIARFGGVLYACRDTPEERAANIQKKIEKFQALMGASEVVKT